MVMGPTHAMSGAAAWLAGAPAVTALLGRPASTTEELFVGAAVCAGCCLLPDIDSPQSTVSRSFGILSQALSHVVNSLCAGLRNLTATRADGTISDGHRTVTHTAVFAIAAGVAVSSLVAAFGEPATIAVLFLTLGLAIRGLMGDWAKKQGWIGVTLVSLVGAGLATVVLDDGRLWWLGAAVTVGIVLHTLGDALTKEGSPLLAPLRIRGKGWWEFSTGLLSFRAGGVVEYGLVAPALTAVALLGALHAVDPVLYTAVTGRG